MGEVQPIFYNSDWDCAFLSFLKNPLSGSGLDEDCFGAKWLDVIWKGFD